MENISADEASASANSAADAMDKAKQDLGEAANTAGTFFDHAKGAANEAISAGSKAAENIVDQKLKEAEGVSICF